MVSGSTVLTSRSADGWVETADEKQSSSKRAGNCTPSTVKGRWRQRRTTSSGYLPWRKMTRSRILGISGDSHISQTLISCCGTSVPSSTPMSICHRIECLRPNRVLATGILRCFLWFFDPASGWSCRFQHPEAMSLNLSVAEPVEQVSRSGMQSGEGQAD